MKIFDRAGEWKDRVNFVDENNVVLGYDTQHFCCERADWFIAKQVTKDKLESDYVHTNDMPGWVFDTEFFEWFNSEDLKDGDDDFYGLVDEGGMAVFRIVNGDDELFIHLYNEQNGYYSHGFDFKVGEELKENGHL